MLQARLKSRPCKHCKARFMQERPGQAVCGWECGLADAKAKRERAALKRARTERVEVKKALQKFKKRGEWVAEAQREFNRWVRARDDGRPCICCGEPMQPNRFGGSVDAGHYLSVGSAEHLRFHELNVNSQRKNCNRPGGTTRAKFRAGMIARFGIEAVEQLEADQAPRKYTVDELKAIRDRYRGLAKELEARLADV